MKLQIVETRESDGNWYKVKQDDRVVACFKKDIEGRTNEQSFARAQEIARFIWENGSTEKILLEYETKVQ